jgi:hypothetical protein
VAHLPNRRLEEVRARAQQLRVGQAVEQGELDAPCIEQRVDQIL